MSVNNMANGGRLLDVGSPHNCLFLSLYFPKVLSDLLHQDGLRWAFKLQISGS